MGKRVVRAQVDSQLFWRFSRAAELRGLNMSNLLRMMVSEWLNRHEYEDDVL